MAAGDNWGPVDPKNPLDLVFKRNTGGRRGSPSAKGYNAPRGGLPSPGFGRVGSPSLGGYGAANPAGKQDYSMVPGSPFYGDEWTMAQRAQGLLDAEAMPVVDTGDGFPPSDGSNKSSNNRSGALTGTGSALRDAYQQMLDALNQESNAILGGFDARQKALDDMVRAETERNAGIQSGLLSAAQQARSQVGESYSQGVRGLQDLAAQYGQMIAGRQPAAEQTLQAFGASGAVSSPQQVQDLLVAQQAALGRQGQSYDALLAGRPELYASLNAEQEQARARQADLVRAQLLAARQQAEAQAARERAQLALQMPR